MNDVINVWKVNKHCFKTW